MSLHVKKGDNVLVITGKDKNKTGNIISANPSDNTVVVAGVKIISKHQKPRKAGEKGGINKYEGKIDASNVQIICPACGKATRIGYAVVDGKKVRVCKKCGESLDSKAKKEVAKTTKKEAAKSETKTTKAAATKKATAKKETTKKADAKEPAKRATKKTTKSDKE